MTPPRHAAVRDAQGILESSLLAADVQDRDGYPYLVHPLLDGVPRLDPHLLDAWAAWACDQPEVEASTVLLAPEAMGIHLAAALGHLCGLPMLVVRKRAYGQPGEQRIDVQTGYGASTLHLSGLERGDRALVVDSILSTGATLDGVLGAIPATGAKAAGALVLLDKGDARAGLERRHKVPVRAACTLRVGLDGVRRVQQPAPA